jgi:nucleoporin NDC1
VLGIRDFTDIVQAFAFWELVYIAQRFEGRRRNIFEDIDRAGGSTWSQLLTICLDVVNGMEARITSFQNPQRPVSQATAKSLGIQDPALPPSPELLPRIAQPVGDGINASGDIFTNPPLEKGKSRRAAVAMGRFVKGHGQSPPESISSKSKSLLSKAEETVLSQQQQQSLSQQGVTGLFRKQFIQILESPLGWPFRQEYRRRLTATVLGAPYGDVGIIVDAIDSLTRFAVGSLTEDKFGNVQKDVKAIMLAFTSAIVKLESFRRDIGIHWTDVQRKQECPEVDTILAALRGALNALIDAFEEYATDLKISRTEMRMAKEAATAPNAPEMMGVDRTA